jgi:3-oxoadipate enol-lactonase
LSEVEVSHLVTGTDSGPAVILSNSLGTTMEMWEGQLEELESRFRVIRYDHRGHGRSSVPPGPYSLADLGGDVVALMDRIGIERAHVVGVSMGGMVGMWLGVHAPDRIISLSLLCTHAREGQGDMWQDRARLVREQGSEVVAESTMERWFTPGFRRNRPDLVLRFHDMVAGTPDEGYAACCEAIGGMELMSRLGDVVAPTLVVSGAEDQGAPPAAGREVADAIAGARFELVPAAHMAVVERPDLVNGLLIEHLG